MSGPVEVRVDVLRPRCTDKLTDDGYVVMSAVLTGRDALVHRLGLTNDIHRKAFTAWRVDQSISNQSTWDNAMSDQEEAFTALAAFDAAALAAFDSSGGSNGK